MFYLLADYIDLIWPQCNYWKTARGFADIKMNSSIEVKSIHMIGFASSFVEEATSKCLFNIDGLEKAFIHGDTCDK